MEKSGVGTRTFYGDTVSSKRNIRTHQTCSIEQYTSVFKRPPDLFRTFSKQSEALDAVQDLQTRYAEHEMGVFSYEINPEGIRSYIVSHPYPMWKRIQSGFHHNYEVIRENVPCKLYFDLEYSIENNATVVGDNLVDELIQIVFHELNISDQQTKDVLEMDSSTETKFSRHLIFSKVVFSNNYVMGMFVKEKVLPRTFSSSLLNNKNEPSSYVDSAVYTKNRNFRLFLNSKFGKSAKLRMVDRDVRRRGWKPIRVFYESLITHFISNDSYRINDGERIPSTPRRLSSRVRTVETRTKFSPYQEIDDYIRSRVGPSGGYIRDWKCEGQTLLYEIAGGYKYCGNIGRNHKSNNVRLLVNLKDGWICQLCHDPDCHGYRSPMEPFPLQDLFPFLFDEHNNVNNEEEKEEEEILLAALEAAEQSICK